MTTQFPSLEAVSNDPAERRRVPRLNLAQEQFRLAANGKIFSVSDLSAGGMALRILDRQDLYHFSAGAQLKGILNLRGEKILISAQVRHVGTEVVGCEFRDMDESTARKLREAFDPERLGREMKPIPTEVNGPLWYHGMSGTDLLLWRGVDGQYTKFVLYVLGSYIQWEQDRGVETGRVDSAFERSEVWGVVRFETLILRADRTKDAGKSAGAKTLILSSNLPQDLKRWCGRQLS